MASKVKVTKKQQSPHRKEKRAESRKRGAERKAERIKAQKEREEANRWFLGSTGQAAAGMTHKRPSKAVRYHERTAKREAYWAAQRGEK